jgi:gas vesicle protein
MQTQDAIREKLRGLNILSETEIQEIMKLIGQDKAQLIGMLKTMGLSDTEAQTVADAINEANGALQDKVSPIYDKVYQALTDGKPDTEEQKTQLQTEIQNYYDELVGQINLNTETQLANLKSQLENGFITMEEYQTRADTIKTENGALIQSVQSTCTDTLSYVSEMSGKSTEEVQKSLDKLEALKQRALEEQAEIERLRICAQRGDAARAAPGEGGRKGGCADDGDGVCRGGRPV